MKKLFKVFSPFVVVLMILSTACAGGTTAASCAFIVGNGTSGYDAKVHKVIYPGQSVPVLEHENGYYVPCNSRNFIVNDGSIKDANGNVGNLRRSGPGQFRIPGKPVLRFRQLSVV
jgi:hypothetical protein